MPLLTLAEALNQALDQEMQHDSRVMLLGEDVGIDGGVFRISDTLIQKYGPDRVVDTPLAESGIVGTAVGLAMSGMRPVVEIQFDGFVYPAFDQLVSHAARMRNRSRGKFTCPLVVRFPAGGGVKALEHHSESMEALYAHTPGLKVVYPSTPYDAKGLLISAIRDPDPVIFMEPKKLYRSLKEEVPELEYEIPIGSARVMLEGRDVTVIGWGTMVPVMLTAQAAAAREGISLEVIDLRTLSPLDSATVTASVQKTGRAVVIHEGPRSCGIGAEISAQIMENCLFNLRAPVQRVSGFDVVMPLLKGEDLYIPNTERLMSAVNIVMATAH